MFGYVEWNRSKRGKWIQVGERQILRLRFCTVSIRRDAHTPDFLLRRRCRAAAKRLRREGVSRAVFPENFSGLPEFERCGVLPVDPLPLYRSLAARLAQRAMEDGGLTENTPIAVCADRLTPEVRRAVTELCTRNRYLLLDADGAGEALCRQLRREYGVPLVLTDDPSQLSEAKVRVLFSPRDDLKRGNVTLCLYPGAALPQLSLRLCDERELQIPEEVSRGQLYAALCAAGALRPEHVEITGK